MTPTMLFYFGFATDDQLIGDLQAPGILSRQCRLNLQRHAAMDVDMDVVRMSFTGSIINNVVVVWGLLCIVCFFKLYFPLNWC